MGKCVKKTTIAANNIEFNCLMNIVFCFFFRMAELINCHAEPLVRFIPVLLDRLISLMVWPPTLAGQLVNIAQACFETIGTIVGRVSVRINVDF